MACSTGGAEAVRVEGLARFMAGLAVGTPVDPSFVEGLIDSVLAEDIGGPLRLPASFPASDRSRLGGEPLSVAARFAAQDGLAVARVVARLLPDDRDCQADGRRLIAAALLHDVGMVTIRESVVTSPDPLTPHDRRLVEGHAKVGAELVANRAAALAPAAELIAGHHERGDGTGYPAALTADNLPPAVRLLAVADVYVALATPRPYRAALDPRTALTDVLAMAEAGQFDRTRAEKLLRLGLYPVGTVVEIADGSVGRVEYNRPPGLVHLGPKPVVSVLTDAKRTPLASSRVIDLATAGLGPVLRALPADERIALLARDYPESVCE